MTFTVVPKIFKPCCSETILTDTYACSSAEEFLDNDVLCDVCGTRWALNKEYTSAGNVMYIWGQQ
jgi:hypothetical protein